MPRNGWKTRVTVPPEDAEMPLVWTRCLVSCSLDQSLRSLLVSRDPSGSAGSCGAAPGPLAVPSGDVQVFFPCECDAEPDGCGGTCPCAHGLHTLSAVAGCSAVCFKPLTVPFKY